MVTNTGERITVNRPIEGKFIPWNPIDEFVTLNNRFQDLFGRGFGYTPLPRMLPNVGFEPQVDCVYMDKNIELYVALPGFTVDCINVEAMPEAVVISGERKPLYTLPKEQFVEGWAGTTCTFRVTYPLNAEIDPTHVNATYHDGVLHLILPFSAKATAATTPVKVIAK